MKKKKQMERVFCLLLLCVLCAGLLSACGEKRAENTIYTTSGYSGPISQLFPGYKVAEPDVIRLDSLHDTGAIEAYDVQNADGLAKYWIPLTLETVVIAIDRDQTDVPVASWSDLKGSDADVSINSHRQVERMMAAAICYGLEGENFTLDATVGLLEPLDQSGKLKLYDPAPPIQICFDSEAAARLKNGENIEIVVPSEGTLSYVRGLLSNEPLDLPDGYEQILLESDLRLSDGRCDSELYPAPNQYTPATLLFPNSTLNTPNSKLHSRFLTVSSEWLRVLRREIQHKRLYTSVDGREHTLSAAAFLILAVIWIGRMSRRSRQKNIRRVILVAAFLIVGWVLIRVVKFDVMDESALTRYLWYSYYIFQSLLPLCLLRIASLIGAPEQGSGVRVKWFLAVCSLNIVLVGLVMTNDLHGMMFKLDLSLPDWSNNYGYGFLYYTVMAVLLLQVIGGIVLMFTKIKNSPRRYGAVFPLIFTTGLIAYIAGYTLRIPLFAESDTTIVLCIFALLFLALCLQAGQIPVNIYYRSLFKNAAGLNLQITDMSGNIVIASNSFPVVSETGIRVQGSGHSDCRGGWQSARQGSVDVGDDGNRPVISDRDVVHIDENTLLLKHEISGGYAVWREDITLINKIKADIADSNRSLEAANTLLHFDAQEKERSAQIRTQIECYAAFEKDIAVHEQRIAGLLDSVSGNGAEYMENLKKAALLICYIKRRSYFLYLTMEGRKAISFTEFAVYIDELAELARLAGIQCLSYCDLTGEVSLEQAMLFYDFWVSLLEWATENNENDVVLQTMAEDGRPTMRVTTGIGAMYYELPEKTAQELRAAGGTMTKTEDKEVGFAVLRLAF